MILENLSESLHVGEIDPKELAIIISEVFGQASTTNEENVIEYAKNDGSPALRLIYDNTGTQIQNVEGTQQLRLEDIQILRSKIQEELLPNVPAKVGRTIAFSILPVSGFFRNDQFQICAVPHNPPKPSWGIGGHPLLIECYYRGSPNTQIDMHRRVKSLRELILFLGVVLNHVISEQDKATRFHWVLTSKDSMSCNYCQEFYTYEGFSPEAQQFSDVGCLQPLGEMEDSEYFLSRGFSFGEELKLPSSLNYFTRIFSTLTQRKKDKFLRAAFWYHHATRVYSYSPSASFVSLIFAIEALVSEETIASSKCEKCQRDVGSGATRRFINCLETFAPSKETETAASKKVRKKLYGIRSHIAHGRDIFQRDASSWIGNFDPEFIGEIRSSCEASNLARTALLNWLRMS